MIHQWFNDARKTYNMALAAIKNGSHTTTMKGFLAMKKEYVTAAGLLSLGSMELKRTPAHIRADAIYVDLKRDYASNFAKGKDHRFDISFKKCSGPQSVSIQKGDLSNKPGKLFFASFLKGKIKTARPLPDDFGKFDCRLTKDKCGRLYLCVPTLQCQDIGMGAQEKEGFIALDPGVRTFMTGFCPSHSDYQFIEYGKQDIQRPMRLQYHVDKLVQKRKSLKGSGNRNKRKNLKRAVRRLRDKISRLVHDAHHRIAHDLVTHHKIILIPTFNVQQMVKKGKLNRKVKRKMLLWSHYRFRKNLKTKAQGVGVTVIECTEDYTSKTCSWCGHIDTKLGGKKVYCCSECGWKIDRDFNGAVNILTKYLTESERDSHCAAL